MKRVIIPIGEAAFSGRAPSHDGEYVVVFYRPDGRWAAVDNGGLLATDRTAEDAIAAADDPAWARGLIDQIVAAVGHDEGEPVRFTQIPSAAAREYFRSLADRPVYRCRVCGSRWVARRRPGSREWAIPAQCPACRTARWRG